jgi:hypothetical protein
LSLIEGGLNIVAGAMTSAADKKLSEVVRRYKALPTRGRVAMWLLVAIELVLVIAAQRDITRRPAEDVRGPKLLWRAVATLNFVGPAAYFGAGRKRSASRSG